jgi:Uma2 family endonuclease
MASAVVAPIELQDYLRFEEKSPLRHEYVAGYVYAMTGGTASHNEIAVNIAVWLKPRLDGTPCRLFVNDMKLHVQEANSVYYPDLMVTCSKAVTGRSTQVNDALLLVEVTSESTGGVDRREKRLAYQRLPSLRAYWVVSQEERQVEAFVRDDDGRWGSLLLASADAELPMPGLPGPPLKLADLYVGTDLA